MKYAVMAEIAKCANLAMSSKIRYTSLDFAMHAFIVADVVVPVVADAILIKPADFTDPYPASEIIRKAIIC